MTKSKTIADYPKLVKEWHPIENKFLSPNKYTTGLSHQVMWKCSNAPDHVWFSRGAERTRSNRGDCPFCSGNLVSISNSFQIHNQHLKEELHPLNSPIEFVVSGSSESVVWKCSNGPDHVWRSSITNRAQLNRGCPFCAGQRSCCGKSFLFKFPQVATQWHPIKNKKITTQEVKSGSNKKYWWKCPNGPDHIWEYMVANREKRPCPFCLKKELDLQSKIKISKKISINYHPLLNIESSFETINLKQSYWWKCLKSPDHVWKRTLKSYLNNPKCSLCFGKEISISSSFLAQTSGISVEWHPTFNKKRPQEVKVSSHDIIWWKCIKSPDHIWASKVGNRTILNRGCPYCAKRYSDVSSSLVTQYPNISKQWHSVLNKGVLPHHVRSSSNKRVFWQCLKNKEHVFQQRVHNFVNSSFDCPECELLINHSPDLLAELHPFLNNLIDITTIHYASNKSLWWKCSNGPDHIWKTAVTNRQKGSGCPVCKNKKVSLTNALSNYTSISSQFHPVLNSSPIHHFVSGSHEEIWWKCSQSPDHIWRTQVNRRAGHREGKCPFCSGKSVSISNSVQVQYPVLVEQWDIAKNPLLPKDVTTGSKKKIWWQCVEDERHNWLINVHCRTGIFSHGCPYCNSGWTIENTRLFIQSLKKHIENLSNAELYLIFQQSGLLQTNGKVRDFVKQMISGKIPKEELEKFAEGELSTIDVLTGEEQGNSEDSIQFNEKDSDEIISNNLNEQNIEDSDASENALPTIKTKDALSALELQAIASSDEEAVRFLLASAKAKLWKHAYEDVDEAKEQAEKYQGGEYATQVKETFLSELKSAQDLKIPFGYNFKIRGKIAPPLLMQRLCAVRIRDKKRYGNWSGTGAGKTISAILSTRVVDAKITVICCPNAVISNWKREILNVFPNSEVQSKTWNPQWTQPTAYKYLIQNYEQFQQLNSEGYIKQFIDSTQIDFIVIDEIHYAKQRSEKIISKRKQLVTGLIAESGEKNENFHVLGMSATPVINNLQEGISLLSMMMGYQYEDLSNRATVNNCMRLYQQLVTNGTRYMPNYAKVMELKRHKVEIDCSKYVPEIRKLGEKPNPLQIEKVLTKARLPTILEYILPNKKTLIYTHYIDEIDQDLAQAVRDKGFKIGFYTGQDKTGLYGFLNGDVDVLIGSSSIGTGVDGLQHVCDTLIINVLPWTNAEYEQLRGRLYRQGSKFQNINIIIPITYAMVNGERWSYCEAKWKRIQFKKSIADAAVDGIIPQGNLRTSAQAQRDLLQWLKRLDEGNIDRIERPKIVVPLSGTINEQEKRIIKYGDFSTMNARWIVSSSQTLSAKLKQKSEEWEQYHTLYRKLRETWTVIPYQEMIEWLNDREGRNLVVGDFGCGEALLASAVQNLHTVHSFDHVAINEAVVACDMRKVSLEDAVLDVAIFSLSLMGVNFTEYLKEAWRVLKVDGILHIWEAQSRFDDADRFAGDLKKLGFRPSWPEQKGRFVHIVAQKVKQSPDSDFRMKFRS